MRGRHASMIHPEVRSTWLSERERVTAPMKFGGATPAEYVPVIIDRAPPVTIAVWAVGVVYPGTGPKETTYEPAGMDCHIPQSSLGTLSTKIVAAKGGLVRTRSEPCG